MLPFSLQPGHTWEHYPLISHFLSPLPLLQKIPEANPTNAVNKTFIILIIFCVAITTGAVWWVSQMGDETATETEWSSELPSPGSDSRPQGPAPQAPNLSNRPPRNSERVSFESPAERTSTEAATVVEIEALIRSGEAPNHLLALDLLREIDQEAAWPLLKQLMESESVQVRAESVELASEFDDEQTAQFLTDAVTDSSVYVGYTVLEAVEELPRREREQVRRAAVLRAPAEVGTSVLADVEVESNHDSVDVIIEGLNSTVEETREESREILDFLFDQQFDSSGAAQGWWQTNKVKYDRDLVEKE